MDKFQIKAVFFLRSFLTVLQCESLTVWKSDNLKVVVVVLKAVVAVVAAMVVVVVVKGGGIGLLQL